MGGKHKQAQRTKHNVKPSSSGRSAELLGTSLLQSGTFASLKEAGLTLPGLSIANDIDACLDANFQLIFKKMNKKDSTTKLKALQQFTDLVAESDPEAVKTVLPIWSRLFTVLATDTEHHIREATQIAHRQVVLKVKRNLAPYLKQLMGAWFTSQFDTYGPAATAASQAFQDAFPPNKLQEALVFCQSEILTYIFDNIVMQTFQTQSKSNLTEDVEARYEKLLIASLQGYCSYLDKVSEEHIRKAHDMNIKIVGHNKFWKLAKHKVAPVRAAWFAAVSVLMQKAFFLLENEKNRVCSSVFGNLDETEPNVLPYLWETVLIIITSISEWWTIINFEKQILPKLWRVLKEGGNGNASIIYPNILPFISELPPSVDISTFYPVFFENFLIGMKQKNAIASKQESTAISSALMECMKYVILKNYSNVAFCENIIKLYLIPLVKWCLTEDQGNHKIVFNQVAPLLLFWSQRCSQSDCDNYNKFLSLSWNGISDLFLEVLYSCESSKLSDITYKQIDFLQALKQALKPKKQSKVRFIDEFSDSVKEYEDKVPHVYEYTTSLDEFICKICSSYVTLIIERDYYSLLEPLLSLIIEFDSEKLFYYLNKQPEQQNDNNESISLIQIALEKWLNHPNMNYQSVITLIFYLFKYLSEEEKEQVTNVFSSVSKPECIAWCIKNSLSHPYSKDNVLNKWIHSEQVTTFLEESVEKLIEDCSSEICMLLKLAFNEDGSKLLINEKTVCKIVNRLILPLKDPHKFSSALDTCARLGSYIATVIYTEDLLLTYGRELLLALFHFSCQSDIEPNVLSEDTLWEVNVAWQDAVTVLAKCLPLSHFENILTMFANTIEDEFLNSDANKDGIIIVLEKLLDITLNYSKLNLNEILKIFFDRQFTQDTKNSITSACLIAEYVKGNICAPHRNIFNENINISENMNIKKYFAWSLLKVRGLLTLVKNNMEDNDSQESSNENECEEDRLSELKCSSADVRNFLEAVLFMLYDYTLACSFLDNYRNTKHCTNVTLSKNLLKEKIYEIIIKTKMQGVLFDLLCDKLDNSSWMWYKSLYLFCSEIIPQDLTLVYNTVLSKFSKEIELGQLHIAKVFGKYISIDKISYEPEIFALILVLESGNNFEATEPQVAEIFSKVKHFGCKDIDILQMDWKDIQEVIECFRFCATLFRSKIENFDRKYWDIMVISFTYWLESLVKIKTYYSRIEVQGLMTAIAEVFVSIENYISNLREQEPSHNFVKEWEDVFLKDVHVCILQLWILLAEQFETKDSKEVFPFLPLLEEFGVVISEFNYVDLFHNDGTLPKWSKFRDHCFELLKNSNITLQLWGYKMLLLQVPGLVHLDSQAVLTNKPHEKGLTFRQFEEVLVSIQDIINVMLSEFKLGEDSCQVQEFTDSFTYTLAYMLLWDILLTLCEKSSTELNYQYADWLKETHLLENTLDNLFRLMPSEVVRQTDSKQNSFMSMFTTRATLDIKEHCTSKELEHMVCWVYASALSQLPAVVRQWWSSVEVKAAQIVEKITATYVSPSLISQELSAVVEHDSLFKNMVIKIAPIAREVIAVYSVDEAQMELVITLPINYPLGSPDVHCSKQIGGTSHKQWLMQLKKCLLHQNGRIWNGLALWNKNLNKKFDGVEECYICFGVLHPGTYQLPKLSCQTCRKKFHSACLYKWFSTSNKSSCPICRNLF